MRVGRYLYCPRSTSSLSEERVISVLVLPSSTAHLMRSRNWASIFLMRSARRSGTDTLRAALRFFNAADFLAASRSVTPLLISNAWVAFILVAPLLEALGYSLDRPRTWTNPESWGKSRTCGDHERLCRRGGRGKSRGGSTTKGHPWKYPSEFYPGHPTQPWRGEAARRHD